jgi:signal transduction histidine kinase
MPYAFAVYDFSGALIIENSNHKSWQLTYPVPTSQCGERISQTHNNQWIKHSWNQVPETGTLTIHSNITDQKQREDLLIETREQARNAKGAQSRFLSRVSHELRTPLNSVLGFSELMQPIIDKRGSWALLKEYTDYIHTSGQHLLSLVDDIIDYTNIGDEADHNITFQTIELQAKLKHAIEIGKAKARTPSEHNILIRLHPDIRYLRTDERILERVIANIISNAIKFSAPDSKISLSTSLSDDGSPRITIRDYGHGMTPEQVKNAFSVFYQADDTYNRNSDGTGMGLSVVKKLVELIGGEIEILSKVGRGTAVILTLDPASMLITPKREAKETAA